MEGWVSQACRGCSVYNRRSAGSHQEAFVLAQDRLGKAAADACVAKLEGRANGARSCMVDPSSGELTGTHFGDSGSTKIADHSNARRDLALAA